MYLQTSNWQILYTVGNGESGAHIRNHQNYELLKQGTANSQETHYAFFIKNATIADTGKFTCVLLPTNDDDTPKSVSFSLTVNGEYKAYSVMEVEMHCQCLLNLLKLFVSH